MSTRGVIALWDQARPLPDCDLWLESWPHPGQTALLVHRPSQRAVVLRGAPQMYAVPLTNSPQSRQLAQLFLMAQMQSGAGCYICEEGVLICRLPLDPPLYLMPWQPLGEGNA